MKTPPSSVVFDLGNVLIAWDPRNLYRKLFGGRDDAMEWFLSNVCNSEWNLEQDRGRSFSQAVELLVKSHPEELHHLIRAYDERWHEMLAGEISGTVSILNTLAEQKTPVYAITNWNQHKFREARKLFDFLDRFNGIIVSGDEGLLKPDPAIFRLLFDRYALSAGHCVFIDDSVKNVKGAEAVGMHALLFETPEKLADDLCKLGFAV